MNWANGLAGQQSGLGVFEEFDLAETLLGFFECFVGPRTASQYRTSCIWCGLVVFSLSIAARLIHWRQHRRVR
jgi:hypothetical protein